MQRKGQWWCSTLACRNLQAEYSIAVQHPKTGEWDYLYVPLPKQVELDSCPARYLLGGGAAGPGKSHGARWMLYRRALAIPDFEALILRKTWDELEKHHLRLMERESRVFNQYGIATVFSKSSRELRFPNNAVIEGGHMGDTDDVEKYLSRERDVIVPDEGSTFDPSALIQLSTRARSTKPLVIANGGAKFWIFSNPGGPASPMLRDLFIDHSPDWGQFSEDFGKFYDPVEWAYIASNLEDNPYLPDTYERDLALLPPWRYKQLRHNNWDILAGQFFTNFDSRIHVHDLGNPGPDIEWCRSIDWGYIKPGCCGFWACLPDGRVYRRLEYKFQYTLASEVADEIKRLTKSLGIKRVRYTAADPAMWQHTGQTGETIAETFARRGVPLMAAPNDRVNGWARVREFMKEWPDGRPGLLLHPDCRYLIRCVSAAVSDKHNPEDVDTNCEDHPLDEMRYFLMSRPAPTIIRSHRPFPRHSAGKLLQDARLKAQEIAESR